MKTDGVADPVRPAGLATRRSFPKHQSVTQSFPTVMEKTPVAYYSSKSL